jgi:hypothetical protein
MDGGVCRYISNSSSSIYGNFPLENVTGLATSSRINPASDDGTVSHQAPYFSEASLLPGRVHFLYQFDIHT